MRFLAPGPAPLGLAPSAPPPSPRPSPSAPPSPELRTRRQLGRGDERGSEWRRDPAGCWGFCGARLRSLPSGARGADWRRPPGRWRCTFRSVRFAPRVLAPPVSRPGNPAGRWGLETEGRARWRRPRGRGPVPRSPSPRPRPGTHALAWAAHPGPGPEEGAARAWG